MNPDQSQSTPPVPLYDALAADYDRFVNWEGRLAHELSFFDNLFQKHAVHRVLDTACGTGHHAVSLARRGYQVLGTDLSPAMIQRAEKNAVKADLPVSFAVAGFGKLASLAVPSSSPAPPFDALLCLGNSLPHLLTASEVQAALADFFGVLRPGGLLIIQNRNFDQVMAERQRFMGPQSYRGPDGEWLFVRFYDFHPDTITFNMVRLRRTAGGWEQEIDATQLRPIFHADLEHALKAAGFNQPTFLGSYDGAPFDPTTSGDLIAIATRA